MLGVGGADIEGVYRYRLWREWGSGGRCVFVMLNPSTADADRDDPTIRRCLGFARRWGFGRLDVVNLYALRATDPREIDRHAAPIGPRNDAEIVRAVNGASRVVAAWGAAANPDRASRVLALIAGIADVYALGVTLGGAPRHPLYMPREAEPGLIRERVVMFDDGVDSSCGFGVES